jgi:hypothetical protein
MTVKSHLRHVAATQWMLRSPVDSMLAMTLAGMDASTL